MTKQEFNQYCESDKKHFDLNISGVNETLEETTQCISCNDGADMKILLTTPVFQGSLERKEENYIDLKDYEDFSVCDKSLHRTSRMHNTHYVLDESYEPSTNKDIMDCRELQDLMFLVLKDHLKTNIGQLMVSQFESTRDACIIYRKLKEHAMRLIVVQLLFDTFSRYRMNYPKENVWFDKNFDDVWSWYEPVMEEFEEADFEELTLQQRTDMCYNAIAHGANLNYVHHVDVQVFKRDKPPFTYNAMTKLVVSPCTTFANRMVMALPYDMKGTYFADATSRNNGKRFTDDPYVKHEVSNVYSDAQYVLVNHIKSRCHDSDEILSTFISIHEVLFN
jgi:hypothetical protein